MLENEQLQGWQLVDSYPYTPIIAEVEDDSSTITEEEGGSLLEKKVEQIQPRKWLRKHVSEAYEKSKQLWKKCCTPDIEPDHSLVCLKQDIVGLAERIEKFDAFVKGNPDLFVLFRRLAVAHPEHIAKPPELPEGWDQYGEELKLQLYRNTLEHTLNERIRFVRSNPALLLRFRTCLERREDQKLLTLPKEEGYVSDR